MDMQAHEKDMDRQAHEKAIVKDSSGTTAGQHTDRHMKKVWTSKDMKKA